MQQIDPSYHLDTPILACLDLHVDRSRQPLRTSFLVAARPIDWRWSHIRAVRIPLAHISDSTLEEVHDVEFDKTKGSQKEDENLDDVRGIQLVNTMKNMDVGDIRPRKVIDD